MSEVRGAGQEEIPHALKPEARGGGREELPHPPEPEARGGGREEQPHAGGQGVQPRGDTQRQVRGGDERSYPVSTAAGRRYPTPLGPRPGAAAGRTNPTRGCAGTGGPKGAIHAEGQEGRW